MSFSVARTGTLPSGREIPESWNDDGWDIDRWENDGGRVLVQDMAAVATKKLW